MITKNTFRELDSASLYEIVSILDKGSYRTIYYWGLKNAICATFAMLESPGLRISASPWPMERGSLDKSPYGYLCKLLQTICVPYERAESVSKQTALVEVKLWFESTPNVICNAYADVQQDRSFPEWLEFSIMKASDEVIFRRGSMLDKQLLPWLAGFPVTESRSLPEEEELNDLYERTRSTKVLKEMYQADSEDFRVFQDLYMICAMIRGRFREEIAQDENENVLQHSFRRSGLIGIDTSGDSELPVNEVLWYLAIWIVGAAASSESGQSPEKTVSRINHWFKNVEAVRSVLYGKDASNDVIKDINRSTSEATGWHFGGELVGKLKLQAESEVKRKACELCESVAKNLLSVLMHLWCGIPAPLSRAVLQPVQVRVAIMDFSGVRTRAAKRTIKEIHGRIDIKDAPFNGIVDQPIL